MDKNLSRRNFLKQVAVVSAGAAISGSILSSCTNTSEKEPLDTKSKLPVVPKIAPGAKVNLACVGIGNRGASLIKEMYKTDLCNIVALCDVDMGAKHTQEITNKFPKAKQYKDFRKMLDEMDSQIDAVCIGVPDHTHFPVTMGAMMRGKHVYVEKPLARTFQECELLMEAEKKYGVVTQMGNQGHSEGNYYQFRSWVKEGIIKDVTAVSAHMNNSRRWHSWDPNMQSYPAAEAIPPTLDWDTWLGTVHHHDYQKDFINGQWRCWYDFGMGALGDWGAHILDTIHEFLDLGLPYEIEPTYLKDHNPFFFPMSTTIKFKFPKRGMMPPLVITWQDGLDNLPVLPKGYGKSAVADNIPDVAGKKIKKMHINPGKEIYSKDLIFKGASHGSVLSLIPGERASELKGKLPDWEKNMPNHAANFLLSVQGKAKPTSPFSISGPLSQVFCLGVLAQRFGTKLIFDRETKRITNNPLADIMLRGDGPRLGWDDYYKL